MKRTWPPQPAARRRACYPLGAAVSTSLLDKRETRIRTMFGNIAPRYDLLNHLLSLNIDRYWRWRTTQLAPPVGPEPILDVCTGTGDLALAYDRAARRRVPIIGTDFCLPMLLPARARGGVARRRGGGGQAAGGRAGGGAVRARHFRHRDAIHWDEEVP